MELTATEIVSLVSEVIALLGIIVAGMLSLSIVIEGLKCLLRSEMLHIYYKHLELAEIRQYELENFIMLYRAYKKLKGNSFIDKVYSEVSKWKVVS